MHHLLKPLSRKQLRHRKRKKRLKSPVIENLTVTATSMRKRSPERMNPTSVIFFETIIYAYGKLYTAI